MVRHGRGGVGLRAHTLPSAKSGRAKRLPWRYRWHDDARDDVLARLLKLNAERAEAERLAGPGLATGAKNRRKNGGKKA